MQEDEGFGWPQSGNSPGSVRFFGAIYCYICSLRRYLSTRRRARLPPRPAFTSKYVLRCEFLDGFSGARGATGQSLQAKEFVSLSRAITCPVLVRPPHCVLPVPRLCPASAPLLTTANCRVWLGVPRCPAYAPPVPRSSPQLTAAYG
jgi:hypothetical protein